MLMKLFITCLFLIPFLSLDAQSVILLEQDSIAEVHENVDLSNNFIDFPLDLFFENNTNDTIQVNWERILSSNCPAAWDIIALDQYLTYVPAIHASQFPLILSPTDSHFIVRQIFYPRMVAGCCDITLLFTLEGSPNQPIDTGYYHIEVNSTGCVTVSSSKLIKEQFKVFPNPVNDVLFIENFESISSLQILDITGKSRQEWSDLNTNQINLSDLEQGMYFLRIHNFSGEFYVQKILKE